MPTCRSCAYVRISTAYEITADGNCEAPLPYWLLPHMVELDSPHECRVWKPKDLKAARAIDHEDDGA